MGKAPGFYFMPNDWERDTAHHPPQYGQWWMLLLGRMHFQPDKRLTLDPASFGRIMRVSPAKAARIIDYLAQHKICDVVTLGNGHVTVMCRRWEKEKIAKEHGRLRVERHRVKRLGNGAVTAPLSQETSLRSFRTVLSPPPKSSPREDLKSNPPTPPLQGGAISDRKLLSLAEGVLENYPGKGSRDVARRSIVRLLKLHPPELGPCALAGLKACVANYQRHLRVQETESEFIITCHNFFGRAARWREHLTLSEEAATDAKLEAILSSFNP